MTKNNQNKPQISIFQPLGNNAKIHVRIEDEKKGTRLLLIL